MQFKLRHQQAIAVLSFCGVTITSFASAVDASTSDWVGQVSGDMVDSGHLVCNGYAEAIQLERYRRDNRDIDTYRFSLDCSNGTTAVDNTYTRGSIADSGTSFCGSQAPMRGLYFERFAENNGDQDRYRVQALCRDNINGMLAGNPVGSRQSNDTLFCREPGEAIFGIDYQYWRQETGDKDFYRFRIHCD
ncbi:MAG: hypothetical protein AAGH78_09995 [Cyanobacteria bacterium P01_H01_bin.58]